MKNYFKLLSYLFFYPFLFLKKPRVMILFYHSVGESNWKHQISERDFTKQIEYLVKNFNIISLDKLMNFVDGKITLPDKTIALTFDDGYEDNYQLIFPIIKKYNLPIVIFLTTNLDRMECLGNLSRLTWEQIKEMQESGLVKFEVHGHDHLNLRKSSNDPEKLKEQIIKSRDLIQLQLNYHSEYFAYPFGHRDSKIVVFLKNNGFAAAFSITEGLLKPEDDRYCIRRVLIDSTMNWLLFKLRVNGTFHFQRIFLNFLRKIF